MNIIFACSLVVAAVAAVRGTWSPCGLSMISAINPMAERARGNRYALTASWFVAGAILGGAVLGGASAALSWFVRPFVGHDTPLLTVAVIACLISVAADLRVAGFHLPLHPRQVNEQWLDNYRRWLYAAGFGLQIGAGFTTYIMTAANYLVVVLAALTGSPAQALVVGLAFGLVRGGGVLLSAAVRSPADLLDVHRRLDALEARSLHVVVASTVGAAVLMSVTALGLAHSAMTQWGMAIVVAAFGCAVVGGVRPARRRTAVNS